MDALEKFKAGQRAGWAFFAPLQVHTTMSARRLANFAGLRAGMRVLDVACGTGVVAVTAARMGARVTGLDLTPELLEVARINAGLADVSIDWHQGDVEQLPFEPGTFDAVLSQFGHMFAPRPEVAIGEMLRVLKPGGTIAFSTWPPEMFIGRMFALVGQFMPPPPPGVSPPPQWGDPAIVRERLGSAVKDILFGRDVIQAPALSPAHYRDVTEKTAGPVVKLVEALSSSDPEKLNQFRVAYDALTSLYFDQNFIRQDYLLTRGTKN